MTYSPHTPDDHAGGDLVRCAYCKAVADDGTRRLLGVATRRWYVTATYGTAWRALAGPFPRAADAVNAVGIVRWMIDRDYASDPRVHLAGFGVMSTLPTARLFPTLYGTDIDRRIAA